MNAEQRRLNAFRKGAAWKIWGPYLSERQWGTVREDYSESGDAWNYFTHDQSRSRAYAWGEDGLAGISDDRQLLCISLALWNHRDPILKERAFGLTNGEGNHGEDVKEYYFYLDSTPTHSYMRYLYKYPQLEFPYNDLVATNASRSKQEREYELLDTAIFDEDRYFDVFVEYAKADTDDILIRIKAFNRGPEAAPINILPTVLFRNTWSQDPTAIKPSLSNFAMAGDNERVIKAHHPDLGDRYLLFDKTPELLFCENETNNQRLFGSPNVTEYVKDGINDFVVNKENTVNPSLAGTKAAANYYSVVEAGGDFTVQFRLTAEVPEQPLKQMFGARFNSVFKKRESEADDFYAEVIPNEFSDDQALVMRQALAGMLWSKQYYDYDVALWMEQHGVMPPATDVPRNGEWFHMRADHVISMPDKWEYPWFAAWDLAFHTIALSLVDFDFAKQQLDLMLDHMYIHPNGQIPAYEWNFSDVNPPVHAWATYYVYMSQKVTEGKGDIDFLARSFQRLLINFTWWVNRKDAEGKNVFQGGFLGLDNIGVFDRSAPLPTGGILEQADGTAWMALYCQNMLQIAIELATHDSSYEDMLVKFVEHFLWISSAMGQIGPSGVNMWSDEDGFFYDVLRFPDGTGTQLKIRSLVGLLPLAAATVIEREVADRFPRAIERIEEFASHNPRVLETVVPPGKPGQHDRLLFGILDEDKLRRVLTRMLDEDEFLSDYGVRAVSREHLEHPYVYNANGVDYTVPYLPGDSDSGMFGGNSNWRGPIWFPTNAILIRALVNLHFYYGDDFQIECPTGSGKMMNLLQVSKEVSRRLSSIFLLDDSGERRPVFGNYEKFQTDPHWRDNIMFHEYFHGDNGSGVGASHQTGWTGLVAPLLLITALDDHSDAFGHQMLVRPKQNGS